MWRRKDFHGGVVGVNTFKNENGELKSSFFWADQVKGFSEYPTPAILDYEFQRYLYLNSTSETEGGKRVYDPGRSGTNISQGNEKVVFRKINK